MADQELERVKQILAGDVRQAVDKVASNFDSDVFAERVADVLAEALAARSQRDDKISEILAPTIDQAISGSIDQDPKKLAESLYPIMGPAIRKSISETLQQMLENFNQLLEESLSPKSLKWRFDAWRTGRSYSELVMLNTLEYRIEQVFLIHRETSLLIQHQISDLTEAKDPDMVSSMFSAIQDFIEDSFATDATNELNTLRLGDMTVVIQRGPHAVLAAVVRGRLPEGLRDEMTRLLESLHLRKRSQLSDYSGDPDDFLDIEPDVRKLLHTEKKPATKEARKIPWLALLTIVVIACGAGYWQYLASTIANQQAALIEILRGEAGIVVLEAQTARKGLTARLLVDPDAQQPDTLVANTHSSPATQFTVSLEQSPYLSLEPTIVERRAKRILEPETSANLQFTNSMIQVSGNITADWLAEANRRWPAVIGASGLDVSDAVVTDPVLEEIQQLASQVEAYVFEFERGEAEIDTNSEAFQTLATNLTRLTERVKGHRTSMTIDIVGFTDASGTERINRILGAERAATVARALVSNGIAANLLTPYRQQDYPADQKIVGDPTRREVRLVVNLSVEAP